METLMTTEGIPSYYTQTLKNNELFQTKCKYFGHPPNDRNFTKFQKFRRNSKLWFAFAAVQVAVHLAVVLRAGRLAVLDRKQLLVASNANVGGPTTASAMATAKGWSSLVMPGILVGISIATFLGIGFGMFVLRRISGF
jgi:hypothetical protein